MSIDTRLQIGLAAAATALIGGVVAGIVAVRNPDGLVTLEDGTTCSMHVAIDWQGDAPSNAVCKISQVTGPSQSWAALGLCADGAQYAMVRICGEPADDALGNAALPGGITTVGDESEVAIPYQPGWPQLEAWDVRHDGAATLMTCACSTGGNCEWLASTAPGEPPSWKPAPKALTFMPGQWRGDGCARKVCWESYTRRYPGDSMPDSCR